MLHSYLDFEPNLAGGIYLAPGSHVIGRCEIGEDCSLWFNTVVRADVHFIRIGARTNVQDGTIVHVTHHQLPDMSDGEPTIIGDDVTIGHRALLHGCRIESACLIGMGAILLDGARIGAESLVAAGSLVTQHKEFPPRSLIMGAPAQVVRELTDNEVASLYASARRYVEHKNRYLNGR